MNRYQVVGRFVQINSGVVRLSDEQAARCRHLTRKLEDGTHEVLVPIQFKRGEIFEFNGEVPKDLADMRDLDAPADMRDLDAPAARRAAPTPRRGRIRSVLEAGARAVMPGSVSERPGDKNKAADDNAAAGVSTNSADPGLDPGREGSGAAQERDPS